MYYRDQLGDDYDRFLPPKVNPDNIVSSADVWDDRDFVSQFWQDNEARLLNMRKKGTFGFKTDDGAVLFPGDDIAPSWISVDGTHVPAKQDAPLTLRPDGTLAGMAEESQYAEPTVETTLTEANGQISMDADEAVNELSKPMPDIKSLNIAQKAFYSILAFGETLGRHMKTGIKARQTWHKIATSVKRAGLMTKELYAKMDLGEKTGDENIVFAAEENNPTGLDERQNKIYDAMTKVRDEWTAAQKQAGVLQEETIAGIKEKFGGYMPHSPIAAAFLNSAWDSKSDKKRKQMSKALRQFSPHRKGTATLRQYAELLDEDQEPLIDRKYFTPTRMFQVLISEAMNRIAIKEFIDYAKNEGLIWNEKQRPVGVSSVDEWKLEDLKGVSTVGLQHQRIHRIVGLALNELAGANVQPRTWFEKLLAITKVGQFFVPGIVWSYDVLQAMSGGLVEWNPFVVKKQFETALKVKLSGNAFSRLMLELGAAQDPGLPTMATNEQEIEKISTQLNEDLSKRLRVQAKVFQSAEQPLKDLWDAFKNNPRALGRKLVDVAMAPMRAISTLTWAGDQVIRIDSVLKYMKQFRPEIDFDVNASSFTPEQRAAFQEAVDYISQVHGAYSVLSPNFKRVAGWIFFVHTFRVLMPYMTGRYMLGFPKMMINQVLGERTPGILKKTYTPAEKKRVTKAFFTTVTIPIVIHGLMTSAGWEPDEEGLPEWVKKMQSGIIPVGMPFPTYKNYWKYKKTITTPDGKQRELVVGINDILNMSTKWINRATKDRPEKLSDVQYRLWSLMKWEINPMYRTVMDLIDNENSFGNMRPFEVGDPMHKKIAAGSMYVFKNTFRIYGALTDVNKDTAYQRQVKQELNNALNIAEKVFLGYYTGYTALGKFNPVSGGYAYTRAERRQRLGYAIESLRNAISEEKNRIMRESRDKPEEAKRRLRELDAIHQQRAKRLKAIFLGGNI